MTIISLKKKLNNIQQAYLKLKLALTIIANSDQIKCFFFAFEFFHNAQTS